ncbi:hypothetical protein FACS189419_08430 [Planctomycetales bacterium]|nr:hypothetical protein FACS189419_08430 [Planctomycetales bacterium]
MKMNRCAFTLVELMVAMAISLILLLGVVEMFRSVAGTMNETRSALNMSANMEQTAALLRQDLSMIPESLATKPYRMVNSLENISDAGNDEGYLEIIEGKSAAGTYDEDDKTVGDVDDVIAFTTKHNISNPYRGYVGNDIAERSQAEIIWFMRGTTLFRRVRLIDDQAADTTGILTVSDLSDRNKRYGHYGIFPGSSYAYANFSNDSLDRLYWLRLPVIEETLNDAWHADNTWAATYIPPATPVDLWKTRYPGGGLDPKTGSLSVFAANPRNVRTGEDIVMTNVISFDIKIWDKDQQQYVDIIDDGIERETDSSDTLDYVDYTLPNVFDSWTEKYQIEFASAPGTAGAAFNDTDRLKTDIKNWKYPPPYVKELKGLQITLRCFDPESRSVKQITVIHSF